MADSKVTRTASSYHSPLRTRQAAETRRAIVEAALTLFAENGWAATSLPTIAKRAGVSVDTIYSVFGTKSALLMAAVDVGIVGDDDAAPMVDRPDFADFARGRRHERLRTGVRYTMDVYQRSWPILEVLREASASDDAARDRLTRYDHDRRDLIAAGTALILGREPTTDLVDSLWALVSPEVYRSLIEGRGWPSPKVEDWFVDMAKAAIARMT